MDGELARAIQGRAMADFARMLGSSAPSSSTLERDGLVAAIVPATRQRSIANSVVYGDRRADAEGEMPTLGELNDAAYGLEEDGMAALFDARDRGCATSSLQASAMGLPVDARLGYGQYFRWNMYERRA